MPVTVTIITLNESRHIAAAIDSAAWADEILVPAYDRMTTEQAKCFIAGIDAMHDAIRKG